MQENLSIDLKNSERAKTPKEYKEVSNNKKVKQNESSPKLPFNSFEQDKIEESDNEEEKSDDNNIPTEKDDNEISHDLYYYTSNFFNKKRNYCIYWQTISSMTFHVGAIYSFQAAITMIYLDDGMDVKYKMILNFLAAPFMILPIYGAIVDTHFVKKWGKSKTYLLLMPIMYCSLQTLYSFFIDEWVKSLNVWGFFGIYFVVNTCIAIYLSAIDAWIPLAFSEEDKAKGSFSRWLGFCLGGFFSYNVFILANSEKWCKETLGLESNLITKSDFLYFLIIYCIATSLLVFLFVGERVDKSPKITTMRDIWGASKQIVKKRGTRIWILIMFFKTFGIELCLQILSTVLVNEGLDKEVQVQAHTLSGIPILIGMLILKNFIKKGKIMKRCYWMVWCGIPIMLLDVYTYYDYKKNGDKNTFWLSLISDIIGGWLKCSWWIFDSAQFAIMVDENISSTHWAAMQTFQNVSNALPYFVSTMLLPLTGFYIIALLGLIYTIIVLPMLYNKFKQLDMCEKEDFIWKDSVAEAVEKSKQNLKEKLENESQNANNLSIIPESQIPRKIKQSDRPKRNKVHPKENLILQQGNPFDTCSSNIPKNKSTQNIDDKTVISNNSNLTNYSINFNFESKQTNSNDQFMLTPHKENSVSGKSNFDLKDINK